MTQELNPILDLEAIISEGFSIVNKPHELVRKRIDFAQIDIYVPKYVKEGCEEFLRRLNIDRAYGEVRVKVPGETGNLVSAYVDLLQSLDENPMGHFAASDEMLQQKKKNSSDIVFLYLANAILMKERPEALKHKLIKKTIQDAMESTQRYLSGELN